MFLFIRLLLAHFIGDYLLQFNKVYAFKLKHRGFKGSLPHALLVSGSMVALSWPFLYLADLWIFLIFLSVTHLLQDSIKVGFAKIKYALWLYLLDQVLHILFISTIFLTGLKYLAPPCDAGNPFVRLYNNDILAIYLIALITATYNAYYLIRNFKSTFMGGAGTCASFEKWYGIVERGVIVTLCFLGGPLLFALVPLLFARHLCLRLFGKRFATCEHFASLSELLLSWVVALATGWALNIAVKRFLP